MSPLDDELRAALHGRATRLAPSPDPLSGIERRARRMRRNRAATAIAGSALAVAAIALAVPALTSSSSGPAPGPAVAPSVLQPSPSAPAASSAFSFDAPWAFRGDTALLGEGSLETYAREWAVTRGVPREQVQWVPLFGEVYEPSQRPQVLYAARVGTGAPVVGLVTATEAGPEFGSERPFSDRGDSLLLVPTGGDEVGRLFAVTAPDAGRLEYAADGQGFEPMTVKAPGVGLTALEGDTSRARVRLVGDDGAVLTADVPATETQDAAEPDNLLGWPARGTADEALVDRAVEGYATAKGVSRDQVDHVVLFTGDNDPGQRYTVLQAWVRGQRAQVFGWIETPGRDPEPVLQPLTDPGKPVVAILLTGTPGRTTDELVVIPQPRTGQVLYTPLGGQERPVDTPGLDGVVLVDRERDAQDDRLRLLDGDGDLDRATFEGPVLALLCGEKGCG